MSSEKEIKGNGFVAKDSSKEEKATPMPEINFLTFVMSLSSSALIYLGEIPNPVTNKKEKNITLAKQNIDILSMLSEKTKGNLKDEEKQLLDQFLYDLRLKYVECCDKDKK